MMSIKCNCKINKDDFDFQKEEWKIIPKINGYEINNYGEIKSLSKRYTGYKTFIMKQKVNKNGYYAIKLYQHKKQKDFLVHRLVLIVFNRSPELQEQCNHKDGNKLNNNIHNLEWVTSSENHKHRCNILYPGCHKGSKHSQAKLSETDILDIRGLLNKKYKLQQIADLYNVSFQLISRIKNRQNWNHI